MNGTEQIVAYDFWKNSTKYPDYGNIKNRRLYELNYLVPRLSGNSLLDLGCGDGSLINCLINLTEFKDVYAFDLSENLLKNVHPSVSTKTFNCYKDNLSDLPVVDSTIIAGMVQYIFKDSVIEKVISSIKTKQLFLRSACSTDKRIIINTFSKKLNSKYSSVYRTVDEITLILKQYVNIESIDRIYPDEIESTFGTKQYYFYGTKKL